MSAAIIIGTVAGLLLGISSQVEYGLAMMVVPWLLPMVLGGATGAVVRFARRRSRPRLRVGAPPFGWAGWVLLMLLGGVFAAAVADGAVRGRYPEHLQGFLQLGLAPALFRQGQIWRGPASVLLHGGTIHLALDGTALLMAAVALERRLGALATLAAYLLPAALAAVVVGLLSHGGLWSMASAGTFGVLGALTSASLQDRTEAPGRWWWMAVGALATAGLLGTSAHGGGAMLALVLGLGLGVGLGRVGESRPGAARVVAAAATALVLPASLVAVRHGLTHDEGAKADWSALVDSMPDPLELNNRAWFEATDPSSTHARLELALSLSARSLAIAPETTQYRDTHATLLHRVGRHGEAVQDELQALAERPYDDFLGTQLARFLRAHLDALGDATAPPPALPLATVGSDLFEHGLLLWWPQGTRPLVIYELLDAEGAPVGTAITAATSSVSGSQWFFIPPLLTETLDKEGDLHVLWVQEAPKAWVGGLYMSTTDETATALP